MKKKALIISIIVIFFLIRPISAQTWLSSKRLTWNSGDSKYPELAVDSTNNIHVVWDDNSKDSNQEIYYKRSTDGGTTWSNYKRLTWNSGDSGNPAISVVSSNQLHLVWHDITAGNWEIYYKRSADGGSTWSGTKRLTWNSGRSFLPGIVVDSTNNIHVVWQDDSKDSNDEIYYKKSTDGGTIWSKYKRFTWNPGSSVYPNIAVDSNDNIHLIWHDWTPGASEIYYKRSTDGGSTWTTKRLTYNSGVSNYPAIDVDSNDHIHVVWYDNDPGNYEIYYRRSTDGGVSWSGTTRLTWNSGFSRSPVITVDSLNNIHMLWFDSSMGSNWEIYLKQSYDGGTTWSKYKRFTWNAGSSVYPNTAVDSNDNIHVIWHDNTPGNYEIYYRKGIQ